MGNPASRQRKILKQAPIAYDRDDRPVGRVINIDPQGMMLERDAELPQQERLQLRVEIDEDNAEPWVLECTVEVLWCERAGGQAHCWVGCAITELAGPGRERLESMLDGS